MSGPVVWSDWLRCRLRAWLFLQPGKDFPLAEPPLPVAAQSLQERAHEHLIWALLIGMGVLALPFVALYHYAKMAIPYLWQHWADPGWLILANLGLMQLVVVLVILPGVALFGWMFLREVKLHRTHYLGLLAERYVGQQLEELRPFGYRVFHDLDMGNKARNIDHVLIGPGGIFVIESKTRSRPLHKHGKHTQGTIFYDGRKVSYDGGRPTAEPIRQLWTEAEHLQKVLRDLLRQRPAGHWHFDPTRRLPIRPLLVYTGWHIGWSENSRSRLRVVDTETLPHFIGQAHLRLTEPEYTELADLLAAHLRTQLRQELDLCRRYM